MRKEQLDGDDVFVIHDFLTPQECAAAIARAEAEGFGDAPITTAAGPVMNKSVRNNDRAMFDDPEIATLLFERARPMLPAGDRRWILHGFNERWRYYRYDPGQRFNLHYDGHFRRDINEVSHVTFMIYLNDDFGGGETNFYADDPYTPYLTVRPVRGMALVFVHHKLHEGTEVLSGRKYVQRTDVMYRRAEAIHAS